MSQLITSEVHTFVHQVGGEGDGGTRLARFMFSTPPSLNRVWTSLCFAPSELEFTGLRRSRSNPVDVGEDSGGEDIEVPRFTSLDCRGLDSGMVEYDSDGDLNLPRKEYTQDKQLLLEYKLATELEEVGMQLWRGSLVLADYFLENHLQLDGKHVLEVGSGTGLASIVASMCGARVIATDVDNKDILDLLEKNVERNKNLLDGEIAVKTLDFKSDLRERDDLKDIEVVVAGDVIYDDDITEDFLTFLVKLLNEVNCDILKIVVALEKRFIFTISDLETVAPAHDFFISQLNNFSKIFTSYKIKFDYIEVDFPQHFCYERSPDMILLDIRLSHK